MDLSVEIRDLTCRRSLKQLRFTAASLELDQTGTKLDLATRIATRNAENESKLWVATSKSAITVGQ